MAPIRLGDRAARGIGPGVPVARPL
jgi:hypothetical protein